MSYRSFGAIAAYMISAGILLFLAFLAWFATLWGVNPLALSPLYIFGLLLCGVAIAVARLLTHSN
jgi:hypothetical protein